MSKPSIKPIVELGSAPVSGDKPAGVSIRLGDEFERIELELSKLDSLTDNGSVDWQTVIRLCQQILRDESKDILVACYLTRGLAQKNLYTGIEEGVLLLKTIVEHFWDDCFPPKKRMRGRSAAFEWLVERLNLLVDNDPPRMEHLESLQSIVEDLEWMGQFLTEKMAEQAPSLADLRLPLSRAKAEFEREREEKERQRIAREKIDEPFEANQPADGATNTRSAGVSSATRFNDNVVGVNNGSDAENVMRGVREQLKTVSQFYLREKITDPRPYRLNRFSTWVSINQMPQAVNGVTQLRPPPKEKLMAYQQQIESGAYQALLPQLETSIANAPFWIDAHRLCCQCLDALGGVDAKLAIIECVAEFVARFPDIINLKFSDESPFANEETQQWLALDVLERRSGKSENTNALAGEYGNAPWDAAFEEAKKLAKAQELRAGLNLFTQGKEQTESQREKFLWRYNQARFCFELKKYELALPVLENLAQQISERGLEEWDPNITKYITRLLLLCYQEIKNVEVPKARVEMLRSQLCRFDLAMAFDLSS